MGTYAKYSGLGFGGGGGGGGGITSINGDTNSAQLITGGTGITVSTAFGDTVISNTEVPGDAFTIIQTDTGTSPTATSPTSTLTLHNSDGTVSIAGDSGTNTVTINTVGLQPSGNYITALTGDGTATGPGSVPFTLASVNPDIGTFAYPNVIQVNAKGLVTTILVNPFAANTFLGGPTSGPSAAPAPRLLVAADIPALSYVSSIGVTAPITSTGGLTPTIGITQSTTSTDGYLSSTDWNTFNSKQPAGSYITALTGDVTATGPGSAAATLATVNSSPGSFQFSNLTVNGKGLVTAASSGVFANSIVNTAGTVTLVGDVASPGVSEYYGTDSLGSLGYHNLSVGAGANTSLSNLSAVAINTSLLPGTTNSIDLGSATDTWDHVYVGTQIFAPLITGLGATGAAIILRGGLAASAGAGGAVTVTGAPGDSANGAGGNLTLNGGAAGGAGGTNESGGAISMNAGNSVGSATGGTVTITSGNGGTGTSTAGATGGTTNITGGNGGAGSSTSGNGGGFTGKGGTGGGGVAGGQGGQAQLTGGTGGTGSASGGNGGAANLQGGSPASFAGAAGGTITVAAGNGTGTGSGGAGGSVTIQTGTAGGDNTVNQTGGSFTLSVGHSMGSSGGAQVQMTAGTGGVGTSTTGASGGSFNINAGQGGLGSSTGGGGGNVVIEAGQGGASGTAGTGGFIQFQTASTTSLTEKMRILAAGGVNIVNGLLNITTAGNGLAISHGSNCKLGTSTLSSGSVVVSNTAVTSSSIIFLTINSPSGTVGSLYISTKTAGTSFTIASTSALDNSTVGWMIVEGI
jgi:hypothetical protein